MNEPHLDEVRVAIVGCGFVADLYMASLQTITGLRVVGAHDIDRGRQRVFCDHWGLRGAADLRDALDFADPQIVLNLTDPESHAAVTTAALDAGRHVWCEKPLATSLPDAVAVTRLARDRGLHLASAPCSVLGEAAQKTWLALRQRRIGTPRLVYAELDDGFLPAANYRAWLSASGKPWPAEDEFRTGCTLEHAGYYLSWLMAFFGPVTRVVSGSARTLDEAQTGAHSTPDYASASLFFDAVVARLTCSIVATHDHSLRVFGDDGVIEVDEAWSNRSAVSVRRRAVIRRRLVTLPALQRVRLRSPTHPQVGRTGSASMNFALGVAEMADALRAERTPRLAGDFALHLTEVSLAIQHGGEHRMTTRFEPIEPMEWAR